MTLRQLIEKAEIFVKDTITKYPLLKSDIIELLMLFYSEIEEEGCSPMREYGLMVDSINELIEENDKNI
jgi:hypothetical protein